MDRLGVAPIRPVSRDRPGVPLRVQDHLSAWAEGIRAQRLRHRLTRDELAGSLQVSRATVQRLEAGDPGVAVAVYVNALMTLGLQAAALPALDPIYRTASPANERVVQRVRHRRAAGRSAPAGGAAAGAEGVDDDDF